MQPVVIYDGDCGFCSRSVRFAQTRVAPNLVYLPSQKVNLADYGLTKADCEKALQFVSSDNQVVAAERAVIQILKQGNIGFRYLGLLMLLPGAKLLSKLGYQLVARNRGKLSGSTNACQVD
jgi:predicted DCC family thiol-disulfide oxidoreductase YuxK